VGGGEGGAGAGDPLAGGVLGDVEQGADLGERQAALEAQQHQQALVRGKPVERLARGHPRVRVGVGRRPDVLVGERHPVAHRAAAHVVDRQVARGAVHPGAQVIAVGVAGRAGPGADEGLLTEVLGGGAVPDHPLEAVGERALQFCEEIVHLSLLTRSGGETGHGGDPTSGAAVPTTSRSS
jgi:hypothetical protein